MTPLWAVMLISSPGALGRWWVRSARVYTRLRAGVRLGLAAGFAPIVLLKEGRGGTWSGMEQEQLCGVGVLGCRAPGLCAHLAVIRAVALCWERCGGAGGGG